MSVTWFCVQSFDFQGGSVHQEAVQFTDKQCGACLAPDVNQRHCLSNCLLASAQYSHRLIHVYHAIVFTSNVYVLMNRAHVCAWSSTVDGRPWCRLFFFPLFFFIFFICSQSKCVPGGGLHTCGSLLFCTHPCKIQVRLSLVGSFAKGCCHWEFVFFSS